MRYDFGKCVIERPRRSSGARSLKVAKVGKLSIKDADWAEWDNDGPLRITNGHLMHKYDRKLEEKDFTDVLGPLKGYMRKSVGRKWDAVWSELVQHLGTGAWPLEHILTQHIDVEKSTFMGADGKVYAYEKYRGGKATCVSEIESYYHTRDAYYVHPTTGLLCKSICLKAPVKAKTLFETDRKQLENGNWIVRIKGVWFIGEYKERTYEFVSYRVDKNKNMLRSWEDAPFPDTREQVFHKIKQASTKEIKQCLKAK
jgi:hypothetical protein